MLLSPRKKGLDSLFKEVRVFKVFHVTTPITSMSEAEQLRYRQAVRRWNERMADAPTDLTVIKRHLGKLRALLLGACNMGNLVPAYTQRMAEQIQSNLSGDTFSIEAPNNLLRTKRIF